MADELTSLPSIPYAPLRSLCEDDRFRQMDRQEAYFRASQDKGKQYNWDGHIDGVGGAAIKPGWVVPHGQRRPCTRYDMAKLIVTRLTSMVFGQDRFPEIRVEGDPGSRKTSVEGLEDVLSGCYEESRLPSEMNVPWARAGRPIDVAEWRDTSSSATPTASRTKIAS